MNNRHPERAAAAADVALLLMNSQMNSLPRQTPENTNAARGETRGV